jgi:hypothetical protein
MDLWVWFILAWARNGVGLSPVSVDDHCEQVTPPHTSWVRENSRDAFPWKRGPVEPCPVLQHDQEPGTPHAAETRPLPLCPCLAPSSPGVAT